MNELFSPATLQFRPEAQSDDLPPPDPTQPAAPQPAAPQPAALQPEPAKAEPPKAAASADDPADPKGDYEPSPKFGVALDNAETLLKYAAEAGISIPSEVVGPLIDGRIRYGRKGFRQADLIAFFTALTKLASILHPVTAASIKACEDGKTMLKLRKDRKWAVFFTLLALFLSGLAFVVNSFSTQITSDVTSANVLAVTLRNAVGTAIPANATNPCSARAIASAGTPASVMQDITPLQQFASLSRDIYKRSLKADFFVANSEKDQLSDQSKDLELNPAVLNYQAEVFCKIEMYEQVRDFAHNVVLDISYVFGALNLYFLPVLYAIVGAYAFRLRSFADTVRKMTFHPSFADSARMIGAFIVGSVVSLFNLAGDNVSLSPLAVAFLAGYAVEVFFALLDKIVQAFSSKGSGPATAA